MATAAVGALACVGLAACNGGGGDDPQPKAKQSRVVVPRGEQTEVPAPGPRDRVRSRTPVTPQPVGTASRPNLLLVTVDDAARGDMEYMPHLQSLLVDQGVTLTQGLAPTPICVPARASLITGQYAHNHGALTINGEGGGFDSFDDEDTLPVWLQDAGYDTLFTGKYLNGYNDGTYVPPGWSDWRGFVDPMTYNFVAPVVSTNGEVTEHHEYSTDLVRDLTVDMLADPERTERPWFLWANYVAPHIGGPRADDDPEGFSTTTPAPEDENSFSDLPLPDKPDMFEDTSDKWLIKSIHHHWSADGRAVLTEARQQRIEALQAVDRALASTVEELRSTGQLRNTYIVLTSDNGYVMGEHNLSGKLWYFRDIVGVPMYVRGPGLPHGVSSPAPVTNADWAPTFLALAGASPGDRVVDGVDVLPYLATGARSRVVPVEGYPVKGGTTPLYTGIVDGPWTYVVGKSGRAEMYDRRVDPYELTNLIRDPRFREQERELRRLADQAVDCAGEECPREFYR